jgi:Bacterial PH domain
MPSYAPGETLAWSGVMNYDEKYDGTLYVTNRRLFFEYQRGMLKKKENVTAETPLKDITKASLEKGPFDWNVLVIDAKGRRHKFMFSGGHPEVIMGKISEVLAGQRPE